MASNFSPGDDVLGTTQSENGVILAQTGDVVGEEAHSDGAEVWGPIGFASRPAKAKKGESACQAITLEQGSNDICIAFRDIRSATLYGALGEGETCVYAGGPDNTGRCKVTLYNAGAATTIEALADAIKLGANATDPVALAPAIQARASSQDAFNAAVMAILNKPGPVTGAAGAVPVVAALASTVASSIVKGAQ